ncbi:MAG: hypothetical protein M3M89_04255 [Thermoproteota archaeon]|nr:hypothetical protein [Thermoproteota archaeon]
MPNISVEAQRRGFLPVGVVVSYLRTNSKGVPAAKFIHRILKTKEPIDQD